MSTRSLFEINHDIAAGEIMRHPAEFTHALLDYLASAGERQADALKRYGFARLGRRHHTEDFEIRYGSFTTTEKR